MKTLIAYYSRGGATRKAAERLRDITCGEMFEIKGTKMYGCYLKAIFVAGKEFRTNERPDVAGTVEDFASYDRILLGFPIWYSKCPQIVMSFASMYNFTGKDVYPFCTSGSSGPDYAVQILAGECFGANMHRGIRMNGADDDIIKDWLGM